VTAHAQPFATAIAKLHAAMAQVANGDVSAIKTLYSHTEDVTSFYGWGGFEHGWEAVSERWDWAAQQFEGGTVSYRSVSTVVADTLAYVTDIESFKVRVDGMVEPTEWSNRVTHIFRLENGEWRLLHRHGNRLEQQYEPGTRLKPKT
jgi:ketosteroid isomerase-like protein